MRWALRILALLLALPLVLIAIVLAGANTGPGRALIERQVGALSGGEVRISGLSGRFPDALRLAHAELWDRDGVYATIDGLALDWSPLRLLSGEAEAERLSAGRVALTRLPVSSGAGSGSSSLSLPVPVSVRSLEVARLEIGPAVAGVPATLTLDGRLTLASLSAGSADLTLRSADGTAQYRGEGSLDPARIRAMISVREPESGLIAHLAGLPAIGQIALDGSLDGPMDAVATALTLAAGPLQASAKGRIDVTHETADLEVQAAAPAMSPRPDVSWRSVRLDAAVHGPFTRPDATGTLRIAALEAAGASVGSIAADLAGNAGAARLKATLDAIRIPGPKPDLLAGAPVVLTLDARLDAPDRPVSFALDHPLIAITGTAQAGGDAPRADAVLHLPDLAPLAAAGGVDLRGRADLKVRVAQQGDASHAALDGTLGITGGVAPAPGLIGDSGRIALDATLHGGDVTLSRLALDGKAIALAASGGLARNRVTLDWKLGLGDLAVLAPTIAGRLDATGHVSGATDDLAAEAELRGDLAVGGMPRGPLTARLQAEHLPGAPSGSVSAEGTLAGAPLALAVSARQDQDGALRLDIAKADWKSAHAEGSLALAKDARLPLGNLELRMTRLDDLRPFLGRPLSGGVTASLATAARDGRQEARLMLDARDAGMPGSGSVAHAELTATVADPLGNPSLDGQLALDGLSAQGAAGSARLTVKGPAEALAARLTATVRDLAGGDATLEAATTLDARAEHADVSRLEAAWKGQTVRLLAPARVGFGQGVTLDRLRLGLGQATLEIAGRASPTLDLTVALRNVTPDLIKPLAPAIDADGSLRADARLAGSPARPTGTVRIEASGLRMRSGPGRGLPPASLTASATLSGETMATDARIAAGRQTSLRVTGSAPIDPARPFDLRAAGGIDLAMLDPILAAQGRRVRGQVTLDIGVAGTTAAPRLTGTATLADGEVRDFAQGARIHAIAARVVFEGDQVRIASLTGRAGQGTISIEGSVGVLAPAQTVDLTIKAANARPLASDRLTVDLDAALTIRGELSGTLALAGTIQIRHADIAIPERLPPSIAVLNVRRPGEKPPPPPAPGPEVTLDLTVSAERAIFVRGRGVFAELAGTVRLRGTSINPQPLGSFTLRQGNFSIAGQTLTFTKGEVSFNGGSLSDPSIDFVASSTNGSITANLEISGTASKPKITLSSTPELPQDEVLAQLLFKRSTSSLSPFELAEIASALAELTGVGPNIASPLENLRKDLGLDQLSIGSGARGQATLQAGRYVAPGVFVGARQGASGSSTQGLVQVDLYKGLKLEGTVGTGSNTSPGATPAESGGSSIGLTYQFEY